MAPPWPDQFQQHGDVYDALQKKVYEPKRPDLTPGAPGWAQGETSRQQGWNPMQSPGYGEWMQSRGAQQSALGALGDVAAGRISYAGEAAKMARDQAARQFASMAASQPGRYNPALQREALYASGQAQADIGGRELMGRAQERLGATSAMGGLASQMAQSDIGAMLGLGNLGLGREKLGLDWSQLGMLDKNQLAALGLDYEKLRQLRDLQLSQTVFGGATGGQPGVDWGKIAGGIGSGLAGLGMLFSDRSAKTAIRQEPDLRPFDWRNSGGPSPDQRALDTLSMLGGSLGEGAMPAAPANDDLSIFDWRAYAGPSSPERTLSEGFGASLAPMASANPNFSISLPSMTPDDKAQRDLRQQIAAQQAAAEANKAKSQAQALGMIGSGIGQVFGGALPAPQTVKLSDIRSKQNLSYDIGPKGNPQALAALRALTPYSYEYRPELGIPGRHVGVMAQDLERTPAGRQLVGRDPGTGYKTVDYNEAAPLMMAGLAALTDEVDRLKRRA